MNILYKIFDWLFPLTCAGCGVEDAVCCDSCWNKQAWRVIQECPYCHRESLGGDSCQPACRPEMAGGGDPPLDGLLVLTDYDKKSWLPKALHWYKYGQMADYGRALSKFFTQSVTVHPKWLSGRAGLLTWIPLSNGRLQERGFNQSEALCRALNWPGARPLLYKTRENRAQMTLGRVERLSNLNGAFQLLPGLGPLITAKSIVIVDDIATTLSTLQEAARVCKKAGAIRVYGLVLAREKARTERADTSPTLG